MALLGATSLVDCSKIPSFISQGSKMIFHMSTVPVSWTKDTTPNQTMCRITNSSLSPGGSLTFSQTFRSSKQISGSTQQGNLGFNVNSTTVPVVANLVSAIIPGSVSPAPGRRARLFAGETGPAGGGGLHTHSISVAGITHSHTLPSGDHNHPITDSAHNHSSSSFSQDFRINYKDFILATKD